MPILHRRNLRTLLVISGIIFMSYNAESFNTGVLIFTLGLIIHSVSKGFLFKNVELAIRGSYSFCRHPFYIANLSLDIGVILMCGHPMLIPIYLLLYYKACHKAILQEESYLLNRYRSII